MSIKTKVSDESVTDFIESFAATEKKKKDAFLLLDLFEQWSGYQPKMWGASMIGFGVYHYKSERSRQEGDWPRIGFSPRKAAHSLYVYSGAFQDEILSRLGKHKMGKGCMYVNKLEDIDLDVLKELTLSTLEYMEKKYPSKP